MIDRASLLLAMLCLGLGVVVVDQSLTAPPVGVPAPSGATVAALPPEPDIAPGALQHYAQMVDRPLFHPSRRPAPPAAQAPPPSPAAPPKAEIKRPELALVGIIMVRDSRVALIESAGQKAVRVRAGQSIEGWTVRSIGDRHIALAVNGTEEIIKLRDYKAAAKPGARPAPSAGRGNGSPKPSPQPQPPPKG